MKVEVLNIPIRHNGSLYKQGESFLITEKEYDRIKKFVGVLEEGESPDPDPNKSLEDMKLDELKAYAKEKGIDLGGATKKEDILAVLKEAGDDGQGN